MFWLTRSQPGADRMAQAFHAAHHTYLVAPVLSIEPLNPVPPVPVPDVLICVSEHAVRFAPVTWVHNAGLVMAVGSQTAAGYAARGRCAEIPPEGAAHSAQGLLEHPQLAANVIKGCRIGLVVGVGGTDVLAQALTERGALVIRVEVYRRVAVRKFTADLSLVTALVVSSGDGFHAASRLWFAANRPSDVPVFTPSARVAALGDKLGLKKTIDCDGASPVAVLAAVERWQLAE